jgi:hypothetical protein
MVLPRLLDAAYLDQVNPDTDDHTPLQGRKFQITMLKS